jgi:hypothetical protein
MELLVMDDMIMQEVSCGECARFGDDLILELCLLRYNKHWATGWRNV